MYIDFHWFADKHLVGGFCIINIKNSTFKGEYLFMCF